jgi:chemotaxis protein MotA
MFVIIGIVIVIGAILGGYLMEHGSIRVLVQPAELVIVGGAALGTVLIANPLYILKKMVGGLAGVFGSSKYGKAQYLESLKMLYELFSRARKEGLMALESDSDNPEQSPVFSKYPKFLKDHHTLPFVCDTIRMAAGGGIEPFDVDQMIENDMEAHRHDTAQPVAALSTMADALPGLGIVAAVLGVVITMGALGGPPEEIGHKVAAALVARPIFFREGISRVGSFGDCGHDEEFFVDGYVLLDGADADGEAAVGAGQCPLVGNSDAVRIAIVGVVDLERIAAEGSLGVADQAEKQAGLPIEEQT